MHFYSCNSHVVKKCSTSVGCSRKPFWPYLKKKKNRCTYSKDHIKFACNRPMTDILKPVCTDVSECHLLPVNGGSHLSHYEDFL